MQHRDCALSGANNSPIDSRAAVPTPSFYDCRVDTSAHRPPIARRSLELHSRRTIRSPSTSLVAAARKTPSLIQRRSLWVTTIRNPFVGFDPRPFRESSNTHDNITSAWISFPHSYRHFPVEELQRDFPQGYAGQIHGRPTLPKKELTSLRSGDVCSLVLLDCSTIRVVVKHLTERLDAPPSYSGGPPAPRAFDPYCQLF